MSIKYKKLNIAFNKLKKQIPKSYGNIKLYISYNDEHDYELTKGAQAEKAYIIIGYKFVEKFKNNERILADMLAHELAHHILGHMISYQETSQEEQDCDMLGVFLLEKAGYKIDKSLIKDIKKYEQWRKAGIKKSHINSHGTYKERLDKLEGQMLYLQFLNLQKR